jgi:hypothetical protein
MENGEHAARREQLAIIASTKLQKHRLTAPQVTPNDVNDTDIHLFSPEQSNRNRVYATKSS